MGPLRSQKGTYSKAKHTPKTEEERRARLKQRKVIPKFDQLFLKADENKRDPFDDLLKSDEDLKAFQEPKPKAQRKQSKKPLSVSNLRVKSFSRDNSSHDTFDELFKDINLPRADSNHSHSLSSSAGSPSEVHGGLYGSLLSPGQYVENSYHREEETKELVCDKELKNDDFERKAKENKDENVGRKGRAKKGRGNLETTTTKDRGSVGTIDKHENQQKEDSVFTGAYPDIVFKVPVIQLKRVNEFATPPFPRTRRKEAGLKQEEEKTPLGYQSKGKEADSVRLSGKSDVITSTPADINRLKPLLKNGQTWSLQASPSLEHVLSPVPKESFLLTMSNSSNLESPMYYDTISNTHSRRKSGKESSVESQYETCNTSVNSSMGATSRNRDGVAQSPYNSSRELKNAKPQRSRNSLGETSNEVIEQAQKTRGRGRPKTIQEDVKAYDNNSFGEKYSDQLDPNDEVIEIGQKKRGRGRPKTIQDNVKTYSNDSLDESGSDQLDTNEEVIQIAQKKRGRGRPKSISKYSDPLETSDIVTDIVQNERRRGRPRANQDDMKVHNSNYSLDEEYLDEHEISNEVTETVQNKRGRGKRRSSQDEERIGSSVSSGESYNDQLDMSVEVVDIVQNKRSRGRPKATRSSVKFSSKSLRTRSRAAKNSILKFDSSADQSLLQMSLSRLQIKNLSTLGNSKLKSQRKTRLLASKLAMRRSRIESSPDIVASQRRPGRPPKKLRRNKIDGEMSQVKSVRMSTSPLSMDEKSLVIGRRKLLSKKKNQMARTTVDTTDTEASYVIPTRFSKKDGHKALTGVLSQQVSPPKKLKRRSSRLSQKNHLEEIQPFEDDILPNVSGAQNVTENQTHLDRIGNASVKSIPWLEATGMSFGSVNSTVFTDFRSRKERRGNQMVYCKNETSTDMFDDSGPAIETKKSTEEEISLCKEISQNVSLFSERQEKSLRFSVSPKEAESNMQDVVSKSVSKDLNESLNDSIIELYIASEDLKTQCFIPRKSGKGWRRTCLSIAPGKIPNSQDYNGDRRQTVQCGSDVHRRMTGVRMSALPSDMSRQIHQMETASELEQSFSLNSSIHTVVKTDSSKDDTPADPREHVLQLCSQLAPVPIDECFTQSRLAICKKIGEGVYGEVFMVRPNPSSMEGSTVLKIMPIEGDFDVNGEPQKKFGEIISEIVISLELSNLRKMETSNCTENYVNVLSSWCVQGKYMEDLLQLWDTFHEEKGSENDRPDIFPDSQLYIVLEFGHGGGDLEGYVFNNAGEALAVFLQITYSLAVAEQELEFEHRDLHWGNVLVATTKDTAINFTVAGATYTLQSKGLKATVIDFTLSRLRLKHCVMFNDLGKDPSLFTAEGDYQFEIYRQMKKANGNDWEKFTPYTNVLWLHYILDKMINECYYKNVKTKVHASNLAQLRKLKGKMLDYESATDFVFQREMNI